MPRLALSPDDAIPARRGRSTRSLLAAVAATAALTITVAGCGGDDEPSASAGASGSTPTDAVFPATVTHEFGSTTVPSEPKRIAVVGLTEQDIVLALGYKPIAVTEWYGDQPYATWPWAQEALGDAKPIVLDQTDGIQFEKVAEARPDLIIGTNAAMEKGDYEKLSKIAPTVAGLKGGTDYFSPWQDQTMQVARALGKPDAGKELIDDVEGRFAALAKQYPQFKGKTATFSQNAFYDGKLYVYPAGLNTEFLTMLGLSINPKIVSKTPGVQADLSAENLDLLESDVLVVAAEKPSDVDALEKVGTYANLDVVKAKRTVYTDATLSGASYFMTPLSLPYVADRIAPLIDAALQGKAPAEVVETTPATTPEG